MRVATLVFALLSLPASAQMLVVDDKADEEQRIEERRNWFYGTRGLTELARPDLVRAAYATELARQRQIPFRSAAGPSWQELGPSPMTMLSWSMGRVAGRASALEVDPRDERVLYLGTASGGLWKSVDAGVQWQEIFGSVGTQSIGSLHLELANPDRLWVGTGEKGQSCTSYFGLGLFLSENAGASFSARNGSCANTLRLSYVTAVVTQPGNPAVVLAGGYGYCNNGVLEAGALYRSTDAGLNWSQVLLGSINDVIFDPSQPSTVYSAVSGANAIQKSLDGGLTWLPANTGVNATSRLRLAMAPSDPQHLYALSAASGGRLYESQDGAATWLQKNAAACEGQCTYNLTLAVRPDNASEVLLGTIRHARSTDAGSTLSVLTSSWGSAQAVHQDTHVVRYSTKNPQRFWVGTDGGLWRTDNAGQSYANLNGNLSITQFYDIAIDPNNPQRIFGGAQDNSSSARLAGNVWNVTVLSGDGFMNLVDPGNGNVVIQTSYPSGGFARLYRSLSGGAVGSLASLPTTGQVANEAYPFFTKLGVVAGDGVLPSQMLLAAQRIYRASISQASAGFSWTPVSSEVLPASQVASSVYPFRNGASSSVLVGTTAGRIYFCPDIFLPCSPEERSNGIASGAQISDFAVDPSNPQLVYATRYGFNSGRLYRSSNAGQNWSEVGLGLPAVPANAVSIDPRNPLRVFVATDVGVYVSENQGDTFAVLDQGMPVATVVMDLEIDDAPYALVAGTYGRGAWLLDLSQDLLRDGFE